MSAWEHARLAWALTPTRVIGWALGLVALGVWLGGCAHVKVHAEREGRCTFKRAAPFAVHCTSDGKSVLDWTGPMALDVQEVK